MVNRYVWISVEKEHNENQHKVLPFLMEFKRNSLKICFGLFTKEIFLFSRMDAIRDVYFCNICNDIISFQDMNARDRKEDQSKCSKCSNRNYFIFFVIRSFHTAVIDVDALQFLKSSFWFENTPVLKSKIKIYPNYTKSTNFSISNTIENQAANQWNNKCYYDWSLFETFPARKSKNHFIFKRTNQCEES